MLLWFHYAMSYVQNLPWEESGASYSAGGLPRNEGIVPAIG